MKSIYHFHSISLRALEELMERLHQLDETQLCGLLQTTGSLRTCIIDKTGHDETINAAGGSEDELRQRVDLALNEISARCEQIVALAKPSTLRLIMAAVLDIGLDAKDLVNAIEREASDRLKVTDQLKNATSFEAIFELPENNTTDTGDDDGSLAPLESIKVTLQSLFASNDGKALTKLSAPVDPATAEQLFGKAGALRKLHGSTGLTHSFDSIFELGRCLELVAEHRRLHWEKQ